MTIENFPQGAPREPKPSMEQILIETRPVEAALARIAKHYPGAKPADVDAAIDSAAKRLQTESAALSQKADATQAWVDAARDVLGPTMDPKAPVAEQLRVKADEGDRTAAQLLAALDTPSRRLFSDIFEKAAAADPCWRKEGHYFLRDHDARHDTPEKLVRAYLENAGDRPSLLQLERAGLI